MAMSLPSGMSGFGGKNIKAPVPTPQSGGIGMPMPGSRPPPSPGGTGMPVQRAQPAAFARQSSAGPASPVPPPPTFPGMAGFPGPQTGGLSPRLLGKAINKKDDPGTTAGPTGGDTPPDDGSAGINTFYGNMAGQQAADWQQQQGALQGQMAGFSRQADSLNARMGGSVAGGYAGLAGQGLNQGMEQFNKASMAYNQLRQATGRDQFNALQRNSERNQEHDWDLQQRAEDAEGRAAAAAAENGPMGSAGEANYYSNAIGKLKNGGSLSSTDATQLDKLWSDYMSGIPGSHQTLNKFLNAHGQPTDTYHTHKEKKAINSMNTLFSGKHF